MARPDAAQRARWRAHMRRGRLRCHFCLCPLNESNFAPDHLTPLSRGGKNGWGVNVAPCCRTCNNLKGNMTEVEFRASAAGLMRCRIDIPEAVAALRSTLTAGKKPGNEVKSEEPKA